MSSFFRAYFFLRNLLYLIINDIAAKAFAAGRFLVPEEVQNSFGHNRSHP